MDREDAHYFEVESYDPVSGCWYKAGFPQELDSERQALDAIAKLRYNEYNDDDQPRTYRIVETKLTYVSND